MSEKEQARNLIDEVQDGLNQANASMIAMLVKENAELRNEIKRLHAITPAMIERTARALTRFYFATKEDYSRAAEAALRAALQQTPAESGDDDDKTAKKHEEAEQETKS